MNAIRCALGVVLIALALDQSALARRTESAPTVPTAIVVPPRFELETKLAATGVQIYRCQPSPQAAATFTWTLVAPEAALFTPAGKLAGRHYAGPTWEANDGSKVAGKVAARADAPDDRSIPWLLLTATVERAGETFEHIAYVQRLNTNGGAAPAQGCTSDTVNSEIRVPYTADYYFYAPDHWDSVQGADAKDKSAY